MPELTKGQKSYRKHHDEYLFGGNREVIIQKDGEKCVHCGMTREEHREKYGKDITVDHIDGNGFNKKKKDKNNSLDNLQTLCFPCHSIKDGKTAPKGESHYKSRLTRKQVLEIRKRYDPHNVSTRDLAKEYGVTHVNIHLIVKRKTWRSI